MGRAKTIVRTEGHRIQQASTMDAQNAAKARGADVVKQWDASLDSRTRETHRRLDGQIREVEEPFEIGSREVMAPGYFGDPAEDCNCRCVSLTRVRWALDEDELQTLKDRAEYFGLDKTKDFEDYKKKYLNAVEKMAASGNHNNDWSKTIPSSITKEQKNELEGYAKGKGIKLNDIKNFDGDPELLKIQIDTLADLKKQYGLGKNITVDARIFDDDNDFARTYGSTITFNVKVLRNKAITEENILKNRIFASRNVNDIAIHEFGHVIAKEKGNIGLEIAEQAYYNTFREKPSVGELLTYLNDNISSYAVRRRTIYNSFGEAIEDPVFGYRKYHEIISEVLVKDSNGSTKFTKEFLKLLKER